MKYSLWKRIVSCALAMCLLLALVPAVSPVEVEAVSGVNSLTCAGFISNSIPQRYIDTMMRYYINSSTTLQNTLNNGLSVVFMFEGGSDNYWNGTTYGGYGTTRNQAVVIVVKKDSSGNAYIAFYNENCSSIPDQPTQCTQGVGHSGSTTILDGIYSFYTCNHTGPYGAFQINVDQGYYTPTSLPNGQVLGASGINIHTRTTNIAYSGNGVWSAGCQVIDSGAYSGNAFNQFVKTVAGVSYNVWLDYYNKSFNTITPGTTKGYYVLDRQLGKMDTSGKQFGSGSLIQLYNSTALNNITASSTTARNNAGFSMEYKDGCEYYASHCKLEVTYANAEVRGQPCSAGTDPGSTLLGNLSVGDIVTGTGIYKNGYGNYWYQVVTSSGLKGYVYGGNVKYLEDITSDLVLTNAVPPVGHVKGATFYVNGTVKTTYNELTEVACYIYADFGTDGTKETGTAATPNTNNYVLKGSAVDDATWMGSLTVGNHTYQITASYRNYYATSPTTLESNTGTVELMREYFVVIPTAVDAAACKHTDTTYVLQPSTCLSEGSSVIACSTCGRIEERITSGGHSYGEWETTVQPDCDTPGVQARTCPACGDVETRELEATGHSYTTTTYPATCTQYERVVYDCTVCGHQYSVFANELMGAWLENKPQGIPDDKLQTKVEYRYRDYHTGTSSTGVPEGMTEVSKEWKKLSTETNLYVPEWREGFDTTHSLYAKYNGKAVTPSETANTKITEDSNQLVGYVYFHWCQDTYAYGPLNRTTSITKEGVYVAHHAFYADVTTSDPTTKTPASDTSIVYANADCCKDSHWYYYFPVYKQTVSTYEALYTYEGWTQWSEWSETPVSASGTRQVESRTLYRYSNATLGDHSWSDGHCLGCGKNCSHSWSGGKCGICGMVCSHSWNGGSCVTCGISCSHSYSDGICGVCGKICSHNYVGDTCSVCGTKAPVKDFYLFGLINGSDYGCGEDAENPGEYRFEDGVLIVSFTSESYVGVKTGDNSLWLMTAGWQGNRTSTVLYDKAILPLPDKLCVPGGVELTFTLEDNGDGTYTLSYVITDVISKPTLKGKNVSLSMEDEVFMNVYFQGTDLENAALEDMGLLCWSSARADGTVDNAESKVPGAVEKDGYYLVRTPGIPAKNLGDTVYFKIYLRLADGSYVYSRLYNYSPKTYAKNILESSNSQQMKALVVAMLNYGAAAQKHFQYKPYDLVNSFLTTEQHSLVSGYHSDMVTPVVKANSSKLGVFVNNGGFSRKSTSITFDGAFAINYYFEPAYTPDSSITMFYWTQEAYNSATTLTAQNASGKIVMRDPSQWKATVEGIAAKNIDSTVYIAAGYYSGGKSYCSGVLAYSLGAYCVSKAATTGTIADLAAATAVYGYYAKSRFN